MNLIWFLEPLKEHSCSFSETSEILVSREFSRIFFLFSLLVLDLKPFQFHFQFSKKSEGILFFTFHFSKKVKAIRISLFFLEKNIRNIIWGLIRGIFAKYTITILRRDECATALIRWILVCQTRNLFLLCNICNI